jgi:hypothetical protein
MSFGLDFWEPLGKMTEKLPKSFELPRKSQEYWARGRSAAVGELRTSDM